MAIQKRPYELSVWVEKLNGSNSKIEEKGVIIGAHDMSYPGRATDIVLKRETKGTNALTFQMPDRYFDSLKGDYVRNEFIDLITPETKLKLFYKNRWFEFFVKKVDDKKQLKSYIKTFTCQDAFIDELSRNGYGITYDTELYNNVEEIGTFTEDVLEDSIWQYHPENNWGDFTEFKEEKLYRIPVSCFGGTISGHKLSFELTNEQRADLEEKTGQKFIENPFTGDVRVPEMSDDLSRGYFWDQYVEDGVPINELGKDYYSDIPNDGYIYVPYSCLGFCYGSPKEPEFTEELRYDRAATETAISINNKLILAPQSVDPRTLIQFYAIPKTGILELDEDGVILNKDYTYFMTLSEWNEMVNWDGDNKWWYMFEDTRLVYGEVLGSADVARPSISHTFKYLSNGLKVYTDGQGIIHRVDKYKGTDYESCGNRCVTYDGYLSDVNNHTIVKGKKFSITDRTEVNVSEDVNAYPTIYNTQADDFASEYSSVDWDYNKESVASNGKKYRVCSQLETRQIIPQLARNLVQNGIDMKSVDGWSPMNYLLENSIFITPYVQLRGLVNSPDDMTIKTSALFYQPAAVKVSQECKISFKNGIPTQADIDAMMFDFGNGVAYDWGHISWSDLKIRIEEWLITPLKTIPEGYLKIYEIGSRFYLKEGNEYSFLFEKNDSVYRGVTRKMFTIEVTPTIDYATVDDQGNVLYYVEAGGWMYHSVNGQNYVDIIDKSKNEKSGNISDNNGHSIVNFGIIGQKKKIEKDKIYCLGVSACALEDFKILIGKGSLVSEGEYTIGSNALTFEVGTGKDIDYPISVEYPINYNDAKLNMVVPEIPQTRYILFKSSREIENPYFVISSKKGIVLYKLYLFEAYTKGIDCFPNFDNTLRYRYSGRDLFWPPKGYSSIQKTDYERTSTISHDVLKQMIIFEDDIMLGTSYGYQHYYIQRVKATSKQGEEPLYCDTMGAKAFIDTDVSKVSDNALPLDAAKFTEDDCEVQTNYIDLNRCKYHDETAGLDQLDCKFGGGHTCFYQKFGYCPFRFETEKHNRRIRTLSIKQSNRFNIIQEISKVFEVYPQFYIEHKSNGSIIKDDNGDYLKKVFFITEKGKENKAGFRYEKNLKDISRNIVSDKIVTKLYVLDVDSEISKTGLCSIKSAEDNISKDSFIIDLSYYIDKGALDKNEVEQDLYGITPNIKSLENNYDEIPSGFLAQLGYYNGEYDKLTNKIINLQDASFTELQANLEVNYQAIITSQEQILKIKKQIDKYKNSYDDPTQYETQQTYLNYKAKLSEQQSILTQLIYQTFYTNEDFDRSTNVWEGDCFDHENWPPPTGTEVNASEFFSHITNLEDSKKYWLDQHKYTKGILGQFNSEYLQIQQWKRERASYLKLINQISSAFYKKYEPYLKEGTWSDSNYLTDNAYYFGALDVAADGAIPKVTYNISVIQLPESEDIDGVYDLDLSDVTYVEDVGMFGYNKHTGLPNRLKVLVSAISEGLDNPTKDSIQVQNYTTSFQDLFQQISASVQSLTYNENIYKRSSNFTSMQAITNSSLQGALDTNDLTLLNTDENNIQVDNTGTSGSDINNHANKYKLDGQGLFFSNDGGQHWSVGVGPSGINADYIKVGTLDAGKIRIADSSYVYFSWDKDGIVAYRDPQGTTTDSKNINDAAMFNKYGLSIVQDNNIRLRAGYVFNGIDSKITSETVVGDEVGFYLYNNSGQVIFSTSTAASGQDADRQSAILKLVGEMMVSNSLNVSRSGLDKYENKYNIISGTFIYLPHKTEIPNWVTDSDLDDPGARCFDASNVSASQGFIAAYLMTNENIPSVNIKYFGVTTKYVKVESDSAPINVYCGNTTVTISEKIVNRHYAKVKIDGSTSEISYYYYTIANLDGTSPKKYQLNDGSNIGNGETIKMWDGTFTTTEVSSSGGFESQFTAFVLNNGVMTQQTITSSESNRVYYVEGNYYKTKTTGQSSSARSAVGLYLNNTNLAGAVNEKERIFLCCAQNGNNVDNLFAITKNGTAYFGGRITNANDALNVDDIIEVSGSGMRIENGELHIDFDRIRGSGNGSLTDYIQGLIAQGQINIASMVDQRIGDIEGRLSNVGSHSHYISVPNYDLGVGGAWININDAEIEIHSGSGSTRIPLRDLFSRFGVGDVYP